MVDPVVVIRKHSHDCWLSALATSLSFDLTAHCTLLGYMVQENEYPLQIRLHESSITILIRHAFLAWDVAVVCEFMASSSCAGCFPDPLVF
jgi:hypothetical protein